MRDELLPGTLDMLILKAISLAPMHGYAIAQHLRQVSKQVLQIEEGSLYPALHRHRQRRHVSSPPRYRRTCRSTRAETNPAPSNSGSRAVSHTGGERKLSAVPRQYHDA